MSTQPHVGAVTPSYRGEAFSCPICGAYAKMRWTTLFADGIQQRPFDLSRCDRCHNEVLWSVETGVLGQEEGHIIYPLASTAPIHHVDLPEDLQQEYDEARAIVGRSARGAAALLRLCLEKLCAHLTGSATNNINDNIKDLVAKGLPARVQQSLDYLRVIGNHAVHPGQIDLQDTPEMVHAMFGLINFIVEDQITKPKAIEALYNQIPAGAREAIERRDAPK